MTEDIANETEDADDLPGTGCNRFFYRMFKSAGTSMKKRTVLDEFLEPDSRSKPMARMWFPDAGAGEDDNDCIEKQILELADRGFGGVEVAMLMSYGVRYTNEESRSYGWGTENWIRLLKKVLKAAEKVPGGFQVDMTITGHWPPVLEWEAGLCYLPGSQGSQSVDFGEPPPIPACLSSALWIALDSSSLLTHLTICVFSPEDWLWLLPVASSLPLALESWKLRKVIFLVWARGRWRVV